MLDKKRLDKNSKNWLNTLSEIMASVGRGLVNFLSGKTEMDVSELKELEKIIVNVVRNCDSNDELAKTLLGIGLENSLRDLGVNIVE